MLYGLPRDCVNVAGIQRLCARHSHRDDLLRSDCRSTGGFFIVLLSLCRTLLSLVFDLCYSSSSHFHNLDNLRQQPPSTYLSKVKSFRRNLPRNSPQAGAQERRPQVQSYFLVPDSASLRPLFLARHTCYTPPDKMMHHSLSDALLLSFLGGCLSVFRILRTGMDCAQIRTSPGVQLGR